MLHSTDDLKFCYLKDYSAGLKLIFLITSFAINGKSYSAWIFSYVNQEIIFKFYSAELNLKFVLKEFIPKR